MATEDESVCLSNPNFAVICSFLDKYGETLGLPTVGYKDLQEWIEDAKDVHPLLIELHVKLLRRIHKKLSNVSADRWEKGIVKFCYKYCDVDAWEIERFGYKLAKVSTKLTLLKNLMESQFDCNPKFKDKINELTVEEMRFLPIGRDKHGLAYWYFLDKELNLRVYREDQDDVDSESWQLVCQSRDDLAKLISNLEQGTDIKLEKVESSDFSDASIKSEQVSDNNEDSRDSFHQRTPHGPSPLAIKQEPSDTDTPSPIQQDPKPPIILKVSKSEVQSPSKLLQKRFKKEKGSELKKIMCKLKDIQDSVKDLETGVNEVEHCETDEKEISVNEGSEAGAKESEKEDKDGKENLQNEHKDSSTDEAKNQEQSSEDNSQSQFKESEKSTSDNQSDGCEDKSENVKEDELSENITEQEKSKKDTQSEINETTKELVDHASIQNSVSEPSKESHEVDIIEKAAKEVSEAIENEIETNKESVESEHSKDETEPKAQEADKVTDVSNEQCDSISVTTASESNKESQNDSESVETTAEIEKTVTSNGNLETDKLEENNTEKGVENSEKLSNDKGTNEDLKTEGSVGESENISSENSNEEKCSDVAEEKKDCSEACSDKTMEDDLKGNKSGDLSDTQSGSRKDETNQTDTGKSMDNEAEATAKDLTNEASISVDDKDHKPEDKHTEKTCDSIDTNKNQTVSETTESEGSHVKDEEFSEVRDAEMASSECSSVKEEKVTEDSEEIKTVASKPAIEEESVITNNTDLLKEQTTKSVPSENLSETDKTPSEQPESPSQRCRKRKQTEISKETTGSSTEDEDSVESEHKSVNERIIKTAVRKTTKCDSREGSKSPSVKVSADVETVEHLSDLGQQDGDIGKKKKIKDPEEQTGEDEKCESEIKASAKGNDTVVEEKVDEVKNKMVEKEINDKISDKNVVENETKETEENIDVKVDTVKEGLNEENDDTEIEDNEAIPDIVENNEGQFESAEEDKPLKKAKGLVAQSRRSKSQAKKRQAEDNTSIEPVEPASKRSKLRGRVSSRGRGKKQVTVKESSSSDTDDMPLSVVAARSNRGRGKAARGRNGIVGNKQSPAVTKQQKQTKESSTKNTSKAKKPESHELVIPPDLSEEDTGRRRSLRVRSRVKKKSPSPDYVPSESEEYLFDEEDDDEFELKSRKRKKREPKEAVEEVPKGKNALRLEAKSKKKTNNKKQVEEEEFPCVKCSKSHQPEWILLCDKCDAGYHTACLRPPLMIIPDGDWFCPPCEHSMLTEKLQEQLKSLDAAIVKNDRLIRRKERLAFVSVSLDNVLKEPKVEPTDQKTTGRRPPRRTKTKGPKYYSDGDSELGTSSETGSGSSSDSTSQSESSEEEVTRKQKFIQRACRSKKSVSYRFEEYDELIMDAIEEDLSIPKEPKPRKVKPPGINRGKDMSNILGASDEEKEKKPTRKRKPRLTELDEDIDDDDTDDYQVSDASEASDMSKSTESYESEEISEDSVGSSWRYKSRSKRTLSRRKGRKGKFSKYNADFIVDSDWESEENSKRRSRRSARRKNVSYREFNSDETETEEDDDDSFHSSELDDSDFEEKRKKKKLEKQKVLEVKERPRSGKRQRIRKVSSTSESSEESEGDTPKKKIGKKPPSKSARYEDSEATDESEDKTYKMKKKRKPLDSESETEEESTEESSTEESEEDKPAKKPAKKEQPKKKNVILSDTDEEESEGESETKKASEKAKKTAVDIERVKTVENDVKKGTSESETDETEVSEQDSENDGEWEEIVVDTGKELKDVDQNETGDGKEVSVKSPVAKKGKRSKVEDLSPEKIDDAKKKRVETKDESEKNNLEIKGESETVDTDVKSDDVERTGIEGNEMLSDKSMSPKKPRGRKGKIGSTESESSLPEVVPKKRGRKPKQLQTAAEETGQETQGEETPVKKKRGRKVMSPEHNDSEQSKEVEKRELEGEAENRIEQKDELKVDVKEEKNVSVEETDKVSEKTKDDSPLSARNKQNAPVGVVKPEVRQGVIVENKHILENRSGDQRHSEATVNPLQGMRDLALGNQMMPGGQSSFTPYSQANYGPNVPPYINQYPNYPQHGAQYGPEGHGPRGPYPGPPGVPHGSPQGVPPQAHYPPNQGPLSPNSYQQSGSFLGSMQHAPPPGYYPPGFRPQMGPMEGYGPGPQGQHPAPYQHGPYPPRYHQGPYQGPRPGYGDQVGPYQMGPHGPVPHSQSSGPFPQGMPYNFPHISQQGLPPGGPQGYGTQGPQPGDMTSLGPGRSQGGLRLPVSTQQGSSPVPRSDNGSESGNRGFMMDNILKPTPECSSNDVDEGEEVSDIDRYTSFLCKDEK